MVRTILQRIPTRYNSISVYRLIFQNYLLSFWDKYTKIYIQCTSKKKISIFKTIQIHTLPRVICESGVFFTTSPGV